MSHKAAIAYRAIHARLAALLGGLLLLGVAGCDKLRPLADPPLQEGVLAIQHLEYGLERFTVGDARVNHSEHGGVREFTVLLTSGSALERSVELRDVTSDPQVNFEATALIPDSLELTSGAVIDQKEGYDYKRDENLSVFYYSSHNSIENLRVEIVQASDEWLDLKVTGETLAIGSNGSKPDAKIAVHAKFKLDRELKRSFD